VRRSALLASVLRVLSGASAPPGDAAGTRSCGRLVNPYPNSRYDGVDLRRIRADGVRCPRARRVVRRAHRKGLGLTRPASGVQRFTWRGWRVTGDLRGSEDRYVAKRNGKRVHWVL
jgi:hypothetical protein